MLFFIPNSGLCKEVATWEFQQGRHTSVGRLMVDSLFLLAQVNEDVARVSRGGHVTRSRIHVEFISSDYARSHKHKMLATCVGPENLKSPMGSQNV